MEDLKVYHVIVVTRDGIRGCLGGLPFLRAMELVDAAVVRLLSGGPRPASVRLMTDDWRRVLEWEFPDRSGHTVAELRLV